MRHSKDDNEAVVHFHRFTSLFFKLFDYIVCTRHQRKNKNLST